MILVLLALGCAVPNDGRDGTAVGNPGNLDVSVVGQPEDITLDRADLAVDGLELDDCRGGTEWVPIGAVMDALGPSEPVEVPPGTWCGAALLLDATADEGQFVLEGETASGTAFHAPLFPELIVLANAFQVDDNNLLVGIPVGEILDAAYIDTLPVVDGAAEYSDPLPTGGDTAVEGLASNEVYEDVDLNGVVTVDDRLVGSIDDSTGASDAPQGVDASTDESAGCGCETSTPATGWLALFGVLALLRRR